MYCIIYNVLDCIVYYPHPRLYIYISNISIFPSSKSRQTYEHVFCFKRNDTQVTSRGIDKQEKQREVGVKKRKYNQKNPELFQY